MAKHYYYVYNKIIESEVEILNLPTCEGNGQITASIVLVKEAASCIPNDMLGTFYSPSLLALSSHWGTLEVTGGNLLKLYIKEGYTSHDAAPFIIGWGFGFLFHQMGYTIFHCSALNINGKGLIVSGVSGAGKSSTALSLINNGATYLADDMAILRAEDNFNIIPSYPVQKVCRDVSANLNEEDLLHISEGRDKFAYHNESDYCDKEVKASHLILLNIHDGSEIKVTEYKGLDKWMKVLSCMYLNELFASFGLPEKDKQACLKLAQSIKVLEISRPRGVDTLDKITETIEEFVNS